MLQTFSETKRNNLIQFCVYLFFYSQYSTRTRTRQWFLLTTRPPTWTAPPMIPITAPSFTTAEPVVSARRWPFPFRWPLWDPTTSSPMPVTASSAAAACSSSSTSSAASACRRASTSLRLRRTSSHRVPTLLSLRRSRWRSPPTAALPRSALTCAWRFTVSVRRCYCCSFGEE